MLRRLDAEWAVLQQDASASGSCLRWAARVPELAGCRRPEEVRGRVASSPDAVLGHLLAEAAAGDALAGRVVLQALLPKAVRMASVDPAAAVDDYVTALWCGIATYPLARRPTSVAANLALDALKAVRRERSPAADVTTAPHLVLLTADRRPGDVVGTGHRERFPTVDAVLARARAHRLVDVGSAELLRTVYAEGLPGAPAAERHGLSPTAVRSRCSRAVRVLARHADLLALPA